MKAFLLLLLLPVFSYGQTIHRKGKEILYKGNVSLAGRSTQDVFTQLQSTVSSVVKKGSQAADVKTMNGKLWARGDMKLSSENSIVRTVNYTIQLMPTDGGYAYRIDSVSLLEKKGGSEKLRNDKDLLKDIQIAGPVAVAAERVLNEMDMNFQRLLAVLETNIKKQGVTGQ